MSKSFYFTIFVGIVMMEFSGFSIYRLSKRYPNSSFYRKIGTSLILLGLVGLILTIIGFWGFK